MKLKKNGRGFAVAEFVDRYGQECSIQKSSIATEDCVWLGVDVDMQRQEVRARMHLTRQQVKKLLPLLQRFAETGELHDDRPRYKVNGSIVGPVEWSESKYPFVTQKLFPGGKDNDAE